MNIVIDNWYVIVITIVAVAAVAGDVYAFVKLSPGAQKKKVQEWLLIAVIEAEKALGGGTGQLKLRKVYEMFTKTFPWLVKVISFEEFSDMVDVALVKMREMLENNEKVAAYIAAGTNVSVEQLLEIVSNFKK